MRNAALPDLTGCRVLVSRARPGPSEIASRLRSCGIEVTEAPEVFVENLPDTSALDQVLLQISRYQSIIFACSPGVHAVLSRLHKPHATPIIAIGQQASDALKCHGLTPRIITQGACHPELKAHLSHLANTRAVLFCSADGRPQLQEDLAALNVNVRAIPVYRYMCRLQEHISSRFDAVIVPGSSAARAILNGRWGEGLRRLPIIAMGRQSAHAARLCGAENVILAMHDTVDAIVARTILQLTSNIGHTCTALEDLRESAWKR